MTEPEFLDESPAQSDAVEDVLDTARAGRVPRWVLALGLVAAVALAAFVVLREKPSTQHTASAPAPTGAQIAPPLITRMKVYPSPVRRLDGPTLEIYVRAHDNEPASDIVRMSSDPSNCRDVRIGSVPPEKRAQTALRADLRGYQTRDTARILDQNAGLCALQVRGRNAAGAVTVLTVTSPTKGERRVPTVYKAADAHVGIESIRYAQLRTADGWVVTFGAVGPAQDLPSAATLKAVADDERVLW